MANIYSDGHVCLNSIDHELTAPMQLFDKDLYCFPTCLNTAKGSVVLQV